MKFICLNYLDETRWVEMAARERKSFFEQCFDYDRELRRRGHFIGGAILQSPPNAAMVRSRNGQIVVTNGPWTDNGEELVGLMLLDARDLNHAIRLLSKHPGIHAGAFEIRAANESIPATIAARIGNRQRVGENHEVSDADLCQRRRPDR